MNHKRKRPKDQRAGCLMCKPHKANGVSDERKANGSARMKRELIRADLCAMLEYEIG